ncbi:NAD(P)-binding protein [Stemphylium lycopersici]|nr:NAD(P)-binding protein [Stemphylium lycopersici]
MSEEQQQPFTLRWGVLGPGNIATSIPSPTPSHSTFTHPNLLPLAFTKDLLIDPRTRNAHDIRHEVVAAASSTSSTRARDFLTAVGAPASAKAYDSYAELVQDANVDIVYIATPHSHHYQHTRLALEAHKHVLVEKPITVTAAQCHVLRRLAAEKKRFMMEAMWTRFFPLSREVCGIIKSGKIGEAKRVFADFSFWNDVEKEFGVEHRMVNCELAGGALLDLGVYSLVWVFMALYDSGNSRKKRNELGGEEEETIDPIVTSAVTRYAPTGADETTTVLLHFPDSATGGRGGGGGHGIATTSIQVATTPNATHPFSDAIRIQATLGDLTIDYAPRPRTYTLIPAQNAKRGKPASFEYEVVEKFKDIPGGGHGMFWEADECARCIREGRLESEILGLEETEAIMRVLDRVRAQGGVVYPERIESLEFPVQV